MQGQGSQFKEYLAEEVNKYHGILVPIKAGLAERVLVRKAECARLHPNPADEFSDPAIGPNYQIISDYEHKIMECERYGNFTPPWKEPILVEKMSPDGYLLLNGHHRWAACVRLGRKKVGIKIINLTQETDIRRIIQNSPHDKRATFDLREVVFCGEDEETQAPPKFPFNRIFKERIRSGIPTLFHFLNTHGYDIWVYTSAYYSLEYIRKLFNAYHVHVDGIVTGSGRPQSKDSKSQKELNALIRNKYAQTVHIDRSTVVLSHAGKKEFEHFTLKDDPSLWSREVMQILQKKLHEEVSEDG